MKTLIDISEFKFPVSRGELPSLTATSKPNPNCSKPLAGGFSDVYHVPVSLAAKDWKVTPRRIRALLSEGRLVGRLQENGYWEVRFPYSFTFGTRGPSLKRSQQSEKKAVLVVNKSVEMAV